MNSAIPEAEAERLAALYGFDILDTPRERDFDEIAELASQICGTRIGVVNFIGHDRQFFKAEVGLGVRETPFDSSFCAKAILEEDFLLVPDATKDARFDCNPLVTGEPHLRFYAGALLKTAEGQAIGTVCVLDFQPRELTALQQKTLKVLARQVMRQLELRQLLKKFSEAEEHRKVVSQEISHRLKNSISIVQAIATQTLRHVDQEAFDAFSRRLTALGRAHDLLMAKNWLEASMHQVTGLMLSLHDDGQRIQASGPPVQLGPKTTLSMSLLLNELATNAVKHGSLSVPGGRVLLDWRLEEDEEGPLLAMRWLEQDGPPIVAPSKTGFGSRLIRMGMTGGGTVEKSYPATGFVANFKAPLTEIAN